MHLPSLRDIGLQATMILSAGQGSASENIARIPAEYSYLLPMSFFGNLSLSFVGGTKVANQTVAENLALAARSPFVSYSKEFDDLLGSASLTEAISEAPFPFTWAGEAGVWVPSRNEVWCVSTLYGGPTSLYVIDLERNTVEKPELTPAGNYGNKVPLANPAGGYYFNRTVYLANVGDEQEPGSVVAVNPETKEVTPLVNSYFGLELPPPDDVVVTCFNTSEGIRRHIYFSTLDLNSFHLDTGRPKPVLPNAFWKFTPETEALQPVIPRSDVSIPNGVAVDRYFKHLFVTDTSPTSEFGGGRAWNGTSSPAIYRYDISPEDGLLSNKVLLGFTRQGVSDGIKVDDKGRVWTAEYEGIVVRNSFGKIIGLFNKEYILGSPTPKVEMANFALAGDTLVILAVDKVYTVKLAEEVISPARYYCPS